MGTTDERRRRIEATRGKAKRGERRRLILLVTVVVVVLAAIGAGVAVSLNGKKSSNTVESATPRTTNPPWPAPPLRQVTGLIKAAGLPVLAMEATDVHYHAHLDVIVDGKPVTVPANLGIAGPGAISSLHTHTPDGIIHIESPAAAEFTLGQLFTEWNVRLSSTCVGGLCADATHPLRFYVNGTPYATDPAQLVLKAHQEIAIVYGNTAPPSTYDFPKGV